MMAVELVAGALLSASLKLVFEQLGSKVIPEMFQGKKLILDQLYELKTMLGSVRALLNDAEEKQLQNKDIMMWLSDLQDVIYHADDLVDKIDYEALRFKLEDGQSSSSTTSKVLKKLIPPFLSKFDKFVKLDSMEILRKLKILIDQKDALGLREGALNKPSPRPPAPLVEHDDVYGRDTDKKIIIDLLLKDDVDSGNNISVIPIVGMGGLGKTTLAQLVYDDDKVQKYFEQKVWVTVLDEFDIPKIAEEIYERVTENTCGTKDSQELLRKLKEALKGKKFLFVLDDVWNESYCHWNTLKSSFESGLSGSKILVTTRSTTVASTMATGQVYHLQTLLNEDCWQLFVKHAFGSNFDENSYKYLQALGRKIVDKCKGHPLAIKSLGGLLRRDRTPKRWQAILNSDTWNEELYKKKESSILPALWLSYRHLPVDLKPCFAFCSIFPKDYEFDKEKLIMLWMGEGFLPMDSKSKKMEEFGKEYFEDLLSRSFFQCSCKDKSMFQMHDLIHDIAMLVSNDFCFKLDLSNDVLRLSTKIRHLSCTKEIDSLLDLKKLYCLREANYLRTFLSLETYYVDYSTQVDALFTEGSCLRVLSLSHFSIYELPNSIGKLKHLRYLDLSGNKIVKLPDSVCSLYNLQTLLLSKCRYLFRLPKNMERLVNLRYLDIEDVPLKEMPQGINKMKCLQFLSKVILSDKHKADGFKITELKHPLSGKLHISGLENVNDAAEASKAILKYKKDLTQLSLSWSCGANNDDVDDLKRELGVLTALRPHTNLKCLKIEGYRNTTFSKWIGDSAFSNLVEVSLRNCKSCKYIPPLGKLASLKDLEINGCDSVCSIGDEIESSGPLFPCLEKLWISNMLMLKEWSFGSEAIVQESQIFPLLKQLWLYNCPKLNAGLPGCLPRTQQTVTAPPSLERVSIHDCPMLESSLDWGSYSKVKVLSLGGKTKVHFENGIKWDLLSCLEHLYIYEWEDGSFPKRGLLPINLAKLTIEDCSKLETLNGKAFQQLTSLRSLRISGCTNLRCLPGEGLPTSLARLKINGCPLLKRRCKKGGEDWPKIQHIKQVILDGIRIN